MRGTTASRATGGVTVGEPQWADRSDYSAQAWRNRVKAARLKVTLDDRLGRTTATWVRELAQEPLPEIERPTKRGRAA